MFLESRPCPSKHCRKFRPTVGGTHIDDADGFQAGSGRFDAEELRSRAAFDALPKFLFGHEQ